VIVDLPSEGVKMRNPRFGQLSSKLKQGLNKQWIESVEKDA